jgi:gas vesicle protein
MWFCCSKKKKVTWKELYENDEMSEIERKQDIERRKSEQYELENAERLYTNSLDNINTNFEEFVEDAVEEVKEVVDDAVEEVKEVVEDTVEEVKEVVKDVVDNAIEKVINNNVKVQRPGTPIPK